MTYIRQKIKKDGDVEVVVKTQGYVGDLVFHPAILTNPLVFELVDGQPPKECEYLEFAI